MKKSCVEVINRFTHKQTLEGKSENTIRTYKHNLISFDRWLNESGGDISQLTRYDVQSYMKHLKQSRKSAATINKVFAAICVFAKFLGRPDLVEDIRIPEYRKIQEVAPKSLERKERNKLLRDIEKSGKLRDIAITYLLLLTGIRVSELVAFNHEDVHISERSGSVTIRNGKGGVTRKVPLAPEGRLHLRRYLESRTDSNQALFLSNQKKRISVRTVQHMLQQYGVHPHELRHTFGRTMVSTPGVDISTVAELMGHADINVTRRYSKPTEADLEEAIDRVFT